RRRLVSASGGAVWLYFPRVHATFGEGCRDAVHTGGLRPLLPAGVPQGAPQVPGGYRPRAGAGRPRQAATARHPGAGLSAMEFAFLIYRFFPYGGQQRNMLTMAREALARGHRVTVLCHDWRGEVPEGLDVVRLPARGLGNHSRLAAFSAAAQGWLRGRAVDLVVGFIKLPGLDAYYAADPCFAEKARNQRGWLYRLSPRTRAYLAFEKAVFGADSRTHILEVSPRERPSFIAHYGTPEARFHTLVPGIAANRRAPDNHREIAAATRAALGFGADDRLLLALGSGFRTKGLDRAIRALGELRRRGRPCQLLVVGEDRAGPFRKIAEGEGVADQVHFLGGRDDVPAILQAVDLLLHPAYRENTGNALLEA